MKFFLSMLLALSICIVNKDRQKISNVPGIDKSLEDKELVEIKGSQDDVFDISYVSFLHLTKNERVICCHLDSLGLNGSAVFSNGYVLVFKNWASKTLGMNLVFTKIGDFSTPGFGNLIYWKKEIKRILTDTEIMEGVLQSINSALDEPEKNMKVSQFGSHLKIDCQSVIFNELLIEAKQSTSNVISIEVYMVKY